MQKLLHSTTLVLMVMFICLAVVPHTWAATDKNTHPEVVSLLATASDYFRKASETPDRDQAEALYEKALVRFERLVADGIQNGQLYYNIGNTYFRMDDLGRAILNYRRAQQYIANDENLRQNLAFALSRQPDKLEVKQETQILKTLLFWHYDLSFQVKLICFAIINALMWTVLAAKTYTRKSGLGSALAVILFLVLLIGGSLAHEMVVGEKAAGVLVGQEVVARKGDGFAYSASFKTPLHAGLEFDLLEERGEWLHVQLRDGVQCWVPRQSAEMI